jgi:F-type H+-transporting ATPase subunit epsilon
MVDSKKLRLQIVTPAKVVFDGEADMVIFVAEDGEMGVLLGHEPLTTILGYGKLRIFNDDMDERQFAVFGGFVEINQKGATLLADTAESPEDIDHIRAERAHARAERRMKEQNSNLDDMRVRLALRRATVRLELSNLPITGGSSSSDKK